MSARDLIKIITFPEIATHDWFYNDQTAAVGVFGKSRVNKIDGGPMTISIAAQITIIIMIHVHNQKVSARRAPTGQHASRQGSNQIHTHIYTLTIPTWHPVSHIYTETVRGPPKRSGLGVKGRASLIKIHLFQLLSTPFVM